MRQKHYGKVSGAYQHKELAYLAFAESLHGRFDVVGPLEAELSSNMALARPAAVIAGAAEFCSLDFLHFLFARCHGFRRVERGPMSFVRR